MMAMMASNTNDLFNSQKMGRREGCQFVDSIVGVWHVLGTMQTTSALFKTLTNFTLRNLTSWLLEWSLPLKPTLDPHVSFFFHILCFQF